jgi:hypothetical protein
MESDDSLPCSQKSAPNLCPEPHEFSPQLQILIKNPIKIIQHAELFTQISADGKVSTFIRQTQDKAEILNISHAVSNSNSRLG